jgi:hypothetical protein
MIRSLYERNSASSQTHYFGAFVRNAQKTTETSFFIREIGLNPVRWTKPVSVILQILRRLFAIAQSDTSWRHPE